MIKLKKMTKEDVKEFEVNVDTDYVDYVLGKEVKGNKIEVLLLNHRTMKNKSRLLLFCNKKFVGNPVFLDCGVEYYNPNQANLIDEIALRMIEEYISTSTYENAFLPKEHMNGFKFEYGSDLLKPFKEGGEIYEEYYYQEALNALRNASSIKNKKLKKEIKKMAKKRL